MAPNTTHLKGFSGSKQWLGEQALPSATVFSCGNEPKQT
jgi:hypothetical protein